MAVAVIHDKDSQFLLRECEYAAALTMATKANEVLPSPIPVQHLHILENKLSILQSLSRFGDVRFALEKYQHEKLPPLLLHRKQRLQANLYLVECTAAYEPVAKLLNGIRTSGLLNGADQWRSMNDYAMALMFKGNYKEAEEQIRDAHAMRTKHLGPNHRDLLTSVAYFGRSFDEGWEVRRSSSPHSACFSWKGDCVRITTCGHPSQQDYFCICAFRESPYPGRL